MRKAQGLSVTTIVIAALAVLVLVVLAVIFTGRAGIFSRTVTVSCEAQGGVCKASCDPAIDEVKISKTRDNKDVICTVAGRTECCMNKQLAESLGLA